MLWCGVDGGGTKTTFTVFDEELRALKSKTLPSVHPAQTNSEDIAAILQEGRLWACGVCSSINDDAIGFGLGLAGYGINPEFRAVLDRAVSTVFADDCHLLMSDVEAAFDSSLGDADGIVLISGTGSVGFARFGGEIYRCGGWGPFIGDEGSGYWIGKKVIEEVSKQADGRSYTTLLFTRTMDKLELNDPSELVQCCMSGDLSRREHVAGLARVCFEAYRDDDAAAVRIVNQAARELASIIESLLSKADKVCSSDFKVDCVLKGGVLDHAPELRELIGKRVGDNVRFVQAEHDVSLGCVRSLMKTSQPR